MKQSPTLFRQWATGILALLPAFLFAQAVNYSVKGTVIDDSHAPLASVSVILVEARQATFTDERGFYDLSGAVAEGTYTLEFRYFGFQTERRTITIALGKANFNEDVTLGSDILKLDEVVVTGTSPTATRKQLGNYVGVVDGKSLEKAATVNPLGALSGKVAGAQITQNQGDPAGGFSIRLRGVSSIKGSSDPLYIIDGVIVDNSSQNVINLSGDAMTTNFRAGQNRLVDINPNDIERIEVLNGASAAALYGSRAANGVVQIFTKRGRSSKPSVEFSTSAGISKLRKKVFFTTYGKRFGVKGNDRLETAQDRLTILLNLYPAAPGKTQAQTMTDNGINYVNAGGRLLITDQYDVTRYDYQDEIFQTAFGTENYLSVTGGNEKSNYFASLGYTNNDGIVKNTNFTKYTGRLRLNQTLSKWASLTTGLSYTNSRSKDMPNGNNFFSPVSTMYIIDNVWDITERNADGTLKQVEQVRVNPLTVLETFDITQRTNRSIADIGLKLFPFKGFRIDYTFGIDHYSLLGNEYHPRIPYPGVAATFFPDGYVAIANSNLTQYNSDLLATYETTFGPKLTSTTTAGYQYQRQRADLASQEGRDLTPLIRTISAASNLFSLPQQSISELSLNGYFLQETFGWDEQLFLTLAGRIDGSSAFSTDNQTNFYPKASMSWVASRLFRSTAVSTLKFRASYGQAGNLTGIGPYDRFNNFAGTLLNALPAVTPPRALNNPDVKPEVMTETEAGFDLALLRNRIGLSFSWYNQDIDNLLFNRLIPPSIGGTSLVTNVGKMSNTGVEVLLQAQAVRSNNFSWDLGLNFSLNRNEVSGLEGVLVLRGSDGAQSALNGEPFGIFFGRYYARNNDGSLLLTSQGLAQPERGLVIPESQFNEDNLPAGALTDRIYRYAGSVYVPVRDANGQPLTTGTQELRKVLGNPFPDWVGAISSTLTWKKLSFNFQFDAYMGADVYNWNRITSNNVGFGQLAEKELKGEVARGYVASVAGGVTGQRIQEEHIEDGSFIKLRELGLTYNFGRIGRTFENLSVSFMGRNLVSFDDYLGFDPETNSAGQNDQVRGDDFGNVPIPQSFMIRLNGRF